MKKLLTMLVALATSSSLFASYSGNPIQSTLTPESLYGGSFDCGCFPARLRLSYQRDTVADRKLRCKDQNFRIDDAAMTSDMGIVALTIYDKFEIYGGAGGAQFLFGCRPNAAAPTPNHVRIEFETYDKLCYTVGGRVALYENECGTAIGLTGNWFHAEPLMEWDDLHQGATPTQANLRWNEWQLALGVAQRISFFTPYAAVKYSAVRGRIQDTLIAQGGGPTTITFDQFNIRSRHHIGAVFGVTLSNYEAFFLNFEARVFDERAFTIEGGLTF